MEWKQLRAVQSSDQAKDPTFRRKDGFERYRIVKIDPKTGEIIPESKKNRTFDFLHQAMQALPKDCTLVSYQLLLKESKNVVKEQKEPKQLSKDKPWIINLFAGPGAGKGKAARKIVEALKGKGITAAYVPGPQKKMLKKDPKQLDGSIKTQKKLYGLQKERLKKEAKLSKVIVTDSPLSVYPLYVKKSDMGFSKEVIKDFRKDQSLNIYLEREAEYQRGDRKESFQQSEDLDLSIWQMLKQFRIPFMISNQETLGQTIKEIEKQMSEMEKNPEQISELSRESIPGIDETRLLSRRSVWQKEATFDEEPTLDGVIEEEEIVMELTQN